RDADDGRLRGAEPAAAGAPALRGGDPAHAGGHGPGRRAVPARRDGARDRLARRRRAAGDRHAGPGLRAQGPGAPDRPGRHAALAALAVLQRHGADRRCGPDAAGHRDLRRRRRGDGAHLPHVHLHPHRQGDARRRHEPPRGADRRHPPVAHPHDGVGAGRADLGHRGAAHHAQGAGHARHRAHRHPGLRGGHRGRLHQPARRRGRRPADRRGREHGGPVHLHQRDRGGALPGDPGDADRAAAGPAGRQGAGEEGMKKRFSLDHLALLVLLAVLCVLPFTVTGYVLYVVNLLMVFVVLALGMHVVIGEAGQFALSHTAFYGIGIYTAGLINTAWHPPFVVSILAGGLLSAVLGYVIGFLALRMRDIYLALATFAFGEAMQWVFLNWESVTNGSNGMRMQPAQLFGLTLTNDLQAYPFVIAIAALMLWVTVWLSRSQFGSALRAVRESDVAAMAMGINARAMKQAAFVISAAFAG